MGIWNTVLQVTLISVKHCCICSVRSRSTITPTRWYDRVKLMSNRRRLANLSWPARKRGHWRSSVAGRSLILGRLWDLEAEENTWWRHQMEIFSALLALLRGIHRSPVNAPHKGQWRGALMFSFICARTNHRGACDLGRHHADYNVSVMQLCS